MHLLLALVLNSVALIITAYVVPGFNIANPQTAVVAAIVLGAINTFVKPALSYVTAPVNVVTLGLFTFVINAVLLYLVTLVVPGVILDGWVPAVVAAVVLSVVSTVLSAVLRDLAKDLNKKK